MSADSINRPLIDQQMADALSQYGAMKSAEGAEKLKEMLKGSEDTSLGFETLGLGVPPSVMALKAVYDSKPVQTALPYLKQYVTDVSEQGFDHANNALKSALTEKIQQAAMDKLQDAEGVVRGKALELQTKAENIAEGVKNEVEGRLADAQTKIDEFQQNVEGRLAEAQDQVANFQDNVQAELNTRANFLQETIQNEVTSRASQLDQQAMSGIRSVQSEVRGASEDGLSELAGMQYRAGQLASNAEESAGNLANAGRSLLSRITSPQGIATQQEESPSAISNFLNIFKSNTTPKPDPIDSEFGTDALIGQDTTNSVISSIKTGIANVGENVAKATGADVGEGVGADIGEEGTVGLLETIGGALDATGVGAIAGAALGLAGLGYSLYSGLKDFFEDHDETPAPDPNRNEAPGIQIGTS